jgi:NADH-quinone oxidoreductase subunit B
MGLMNGIPAKITKIPGGQIMTTSVDWALNSARKNSLWVLTFGTKCCAIEMMHTGATKYDWSRFGMEVPAASPRRADLLIVAGTIVKKMAPVIKRLYDQMAEPKYVISMGSCATSGGPFNYDSYSIVRGVDEIIPVDVYIPGCPPRPEALIDGILKLHAKIAKETIVKESK